MSVLEQNKLKNLQLNPDLAEQFRLHGFQSLTEIQKKAVPVIYQKKNSLIVAPTGSGKTECSVIPIFHLVKNSKQENKIKVLYITPLRALNRDVFRRITNYAKSEKLTLEIRHGDTPQSVRKKISDSPPDILITTPETLVILLTQKKMLDALSSIEWVVIDEVHEMLSNERGTQLSLSLERLQLTSQTEITRIGLSATIGNTSECAKFVVGTKRKCEIISDKTIRKYDVDVKYVNGTISDVADSIIQYIEKLELNSPVLLFTNTRGESEFLASILREKSKIPIELHHGSLSRQVREETESVLRAGTKSIVVCTSSLELGIDIGSVELVVHYGSPRQVAKLVQRIGRSKHNRDSSAMGLVITNNADDEFEIKAILERIKQGSIEEQKMHEGSFDVLAHHLVGFTMQLGEVSVDFAYSTVIKAYPFRKLEMNDFISVLEMMDSNYFIFFDREKMVFWKKGKAFRYYFENLSTIPDILKFKVFDSVGKKIVGSLDQRFVGDHGEQGNIFVLRGMQWKISSIDESSLTVNVEPFRSGAINVPYWEGESIPIDYNTAQKVGQFRTRVKSTSNIVTNNLISQLKLDSIPNDNTIVIESTKIQNTIVLHACFGTKVNATLSVLLSTMLSSILGIVVETKSDAYRIVLSSNTRISDKKIIEVLHDEYDLFSLITASISGTHNLNWKTWCVAKKFGIVGRSSVYERKSARFLYDRFAKTPLGKEALRELYHDKYDIKNTQTLLENIHNDEIEIKSVNVDKFSKLAEPILDHTSKYYSSPANVEKGILDLVKARLHKTKHRLVCVRCGKWERSIEVDEVKTPLICPVCKSRQITATYYSDKDLPIIVRKKIEGKKITAEEKHKFDRAWKVSSLIENFGKTALVVMSGYGIGADTAARVLRNMVDDEILYKQIYEAERQYVLTRGFWDY